MTLYKVTDEHGQSYHGGSGKWTKGRWRSVKGDIVPCENGLHLCREQDLLTWLGPVIWRAEAEGELVEADDKVVARKARVMERLDTWNERTARLFAADCAEYALQYATDDIRPTLEVAIYVARCFADGEATDEERSAAWSAAWSAARSAEGPVAWSAAWSAAGSAEGSAAWSAARSAERSAAWSAARSAAGSAAWSAARSAAGSALTSRLIDYLEGRA